MDEAQDVRDEVTHQCSLLEAVLPAMDERDRVGRIISVTSRRYSLIFSVLVRRLRLKLGHWPCFYRFPIPLNFW